MRHGGKFVILRQLRKHVFLKNECIIFRHAFKDLRINCKEAAVYQSFIHAAFCVMRLLTKPLYRTVFFLYKLAKSNGRMHSSHRDDAFLLCMFRKQFSEINISNTVSVGKHKQRGFDELLQFLYATACLCIETRVYTTYLPPFCRPSVIRQRSF